MFANVDGSFRPYNAPEPHQRLSVTALPAFREPTVLNGITKLKQSVIGAVWMNAALGKDAGKVIKAAFRPDITRVHSIASFHPTYFARMLAKIGYAFAIAEASGRFKPFIARQIIGDEPWLAGHLVGGDPNPVAKSKHETEVGLLRVRGVMGVEYLMARIRLFGDLGAPVYFVVVGEL
ncbi:hypothetical protein LB543_24205 [Mesorhizobium sp. ESP7-2]|uniref:hypothetical protein n=1 Tax=Mesorhizobium sp. ESP7-2 TaxID=2876622 RepID=UPI001CCC248A|nr:hypothetical protein [Mesorhizobium sp. ESP7-2]MBZ9709817.1 hypothetical protein [Mesorhizobium sp. ESP7-2]